MIVVLAAVASGLAWSLTRLVSTTVPAHPRPTVPSPSPVTRSPFDAYGVAFFDERRGIAVGAIGPDRVIETTDDGGVRWTVRYRARGEPIESVVVAGGDRAWVTASDTCSDTRCRTPVLRSVDGGRTWVPLPTMGVEAPSFVDSDTGFALRRATGTATAPWGPLSTVETTDGGLTWITIGGGPCDPQLPLPVAMWFPTVSHGPAPWRGWALCSSAVGGGGNVGKGVYETTDGGRTWRAVLRVPLAFRLPSPSSVSTYGTPTGLFFLPDGHGWLLQVVGQAYETADGGRTWASVPFTVPGVRSISALWMVSDRVGYALVGGGLPHLARTDDGGRTWRDVHSWASR